MTFALRNLLFQNGHLSVGTRIPTETSGTTLPLDLKVQTAAGLDANQVTTKIL